MALLLECLIQIKGVADTPRRLSHRVADVTHASSSRDAAERQGRRVTWRLLAAEQRFHDGLLSILSRERPAIPELVRPDRPDDAPGSLRDVLEDFAARRAETVRVLEACSTDQLNRVGIEPSRGPMTVTDLVAIMLAHDTDSLGDLAVPSRGSDR